MPPRYTPFRVLFAAESARLFSTARSIFETGELQPCGPGWVECSRLAATARAERPSVIVVELSSELCYGAIEAVMAESPTPILVLHPQGVSADPFQALSLGALDVQPMPTHPPAGFWPELARKLVLLAQVRVVQHVKGKLRRRGRRETRDRPFPVVAIAASLGGPKALSTLLRMIPQGFKAPIVICQHISDGFTRGLATWLKAETALPVMEAEDDQWLVPGAVFVAPSRAHMMVTAEGKVLLDEGPAVNGFRPSCDLLLQSAARAFERQAVGVVLTGMGRDGAKGLKEIRDRGGHTIAQHESSCVVYGMPKEAVELGAAEAVLPLEQIAPALIRWVE